MKDFIRKIIIDYFKDTSDFNTDLFFDKSPLLKYLDLKTGAIFGNTKTELSVIFGI